jgi:CheY-specific phosphatase CheX
MIELPPPEKMARIVSNVTETMLGITFEAVPSAAAATNLTWRTVMLPITGKVSLTVGLSSDEQGCIKLGSAMFSVQPKDVDQEMMNDALKELVNMTAGLIRTTLSLDQALGLPKVVPATDPNVIAAHAKTSLTVLRAKEVGLMLWILQGLPA